VLGTPKTFANCAIRLVEQFGRRALSRIREEVILKLKEMSKTIVDPEGS
jgi:hypothetical protein